MKNSRILFVLIFSIAFIARTSIAQKQNWAVGLRVGEPGGITLRKYTDNDRAIELNIGTYGGIWGQTRAHGSRPYRNTGLGINAQYVFLPDVFKSDKVKTHYAIGVQFNNRRSYPERLASIGQYEKTISLGGCGTAGLEFFPDNSPLSFFLDAGLYVEVLPSPLFMHVLGGVGTRFNF